MLYLLACASQSPLSLSHARTCHCLLLLTQLQRNICHWRDNDDPLFCAGPKQETHQMLSNTENLLGCTRSCEDAAQSFLVSPLISAGANWEDDPPGLDPPMQQFSLFTLCVSLRQRGWPWTYSEKGLHQWWWSFTHLWRIAALIS